MSIARFLRDGFDPLTRSWLSQIFLHPLTSGYRLVRMLNKDDERTQRTLLRNLALSLPDRIASEYREEIENLMNFSPDENAMFPYPFKNEHRLVVDGGFDRSKGLPYVIHKNRQFFGTRNQTVEDLEHSYRYFVEDEGLFGTGRRTKSPHAYVDADFKVEEGDVVMDVGCSDALFAFDNAEVAGKIYLFESWMYWHRALEASFAPFKDKTHIFCRLVSDKTRGREVRLTDAIQETDTRHYFIKMDIEGGERAVLASSEDFLRANKVKLSCCVYHRQDDAKVISDMLRGMGFSARYSDGYMLPFCNEILFPYFRRGVIYARNY